MQCVLLFCSIALMLVRWVWLFVCFVRVSGGLWPFLLQPIALAHRKTVMMSFDRFWAISLFCCLLHWRHTHFFVHRCHRNHSYSICTHLCTIWWPSEKPQNMYNFLSLFHEPLSFSNGLLFIHFNVVGFKLRNFMRDSTNCTQKNMAKIGIFLSHCPHNFH